MTTDFEVYRTIGVRLRAVRTVRNMTIKQLADNMGVSASQAAKYERATSRVSVAHLVLAARSLGVTSSVLTGEEPFGASVDGGAS